MIWPNLAETYQSRINTEVFYGYDHHDKIIPGVWRDERNLSARQYPLFAQRAKRGTVATLTDPQGLLAKDALMYIDGSQVIYNGLPVANVTLSTAEDMLPKQMVSMGAYAVIFPDKVYINTADLSDVGNLDAKYVAIDGLDITAQMCRVDGSAYEVKDIGDVAPDAPVNGAYWIDTSAANHVLKQYSDAQAMWIEIISTYVRIGATGIGINFNVDDGIKISGLAGTAQLEELNNDNVIMAKGDDYIVITGVLDQVHEQDGGLIVARECPDMDYVTESNNRIWGCKYGLQDGKTVNEIYACKLGDFRNWRCYAGISTDSYAVSVGTDGRFTGAITHMGYPLFFKENCIHKIYGSTPSEYSMNTTMCRGVQRGSWRSLNIVNEVLYYLSRDGVVAYDGSLPVSVSDAFGGEMYRNATAGSMGHTYYISMQDSADCWQLMTYDTDKKIWHREDNTRALCFANVRGDLQFIDADKKQLISATGMNGTPEGDIEWYAESGIMGYEYPDSKYLSRYNIRVKLAEGATLTMYLQYDSDGEWHEQGSYEGSAVLRTFTVPVIPRRCDHLRMKLAGKGDVKIYSIARFLEGGSDHWL